MLPEPTNPAPVHWHVSRRIPVPPGEAAHALGEALRTGAVETDVAAIATVGAVQHTRPGEARGFAGAMRLGGLGRAAHVEVTLEPWSARESVLGLRPARRPPLVRRDRWFASALAALGELQACVCERATVEPPRHEVRRAS